MTWVLAFCHEVITSSILVFYACMSSFTTVEIVYSSSCIENLDGLHRKPQLKKVRGANLVAERSRWRRRRSAGDSTHGCSKEGDHHLRAIAASSEEGRHRAHGLWPPQQGTPLLVTRSNDPHHSRASRLKQFSNDGANVRQVSMTACLYCHRY